jgi:cadmium resistance protein CadD (predicted permease)
LLSIIPIAIGAFLATNLDNLTLLVALLARYRSRTSNVVAGYVACMLFVGLISFGIGKAADIVPVRYLGLLGLIPVSIGVVGIIKLLRTRGQGPATEETPIDGAKSAFFASLLTQLGNVGDTIVTFSILFADSSPLADILVIFTLGAMTASFVIVAIYAIRHPAVSHWIERYAHRVTPFILIIVGAYILTNTATDLLPG